MGIVEVLQSISSRNSMIEIEHKEGIYQPKPEFEPRTQEPCPSITANPIQTFVESKGSDYYRKLYPFLGKTVVTPKGRGELWQVFSSRVGVVLEGQETKQEKVSFFKPDKVSIV